MPDLSQMHKGRDTQKITFSDMPKGSGQTAGEVDLYGVQKLAVFMLFIRFCSLASTPRVPAGPFFFPQDPSSLPPTVRREGRDALWFAIKST
jgi:hypothetical protein